MRQKQRREKLCWTRKLEVKLVEFIKEREYIWKSTDINHKNIRLKYKAYTEFAELLGGDFTARGVRDRWVNIRTTFTHNVKKVRETRGEAAGAAYVPGWHLWRACQFLRHRAGPAAQEDEFSSDDSPGLEPEEPRRFRRTALGPTSVSASGAGDVITDCEVVVAELLQALQPLQEVETDECHMNPSFVFVGRHVTERLSKMRPFDAECAAQKIMDTLLLYSEFNPKNPNGSN